jgi:hypothetical protein
VIDPFRKLDASGVCGRIRFHRTIAKVSYSGSS